MLQFTSSKYMHSFIKYSSCKIVFLLKIGQNPVIFTKVKENLKVCLGNYYRYSLSVICNMEILSYRIIYVGIRCVLFLGKNIYKLQYGRNLTFFVALTQEESQVDFFLKNHF
jgi:hypothetical protein